LWNFVMARDKSQPPHFGGLLLYLPTYFSKSNTFILSILAVIFLKTITKKGRNDINISLLSLHATL